jgi:hypothetical protein
VRHHPFKSKAATLGFALLGSLGLTTAEAGSGPPMQSTFYYYANCTDCAAAAGVVTFGVLGTLTLSGYTSGNAIAAHDFVKFSYSGSNLVGAYEVIPAVLTPAAVGGVNAVAVINTFSFNSEFDQLVGNMGTGQFLITFEDGLGFSGQPNDFYTCAPDGLWPGVGVTKALASGQTWPTPTSHWAPVPPFPSLPATC